MEGYTFAVDWLALTGAAALLSASYFILRWSKGFVEPHLAFSDLKSLLSGGPGRARFAALPRFLSWLAVIALAIAFTDPHLFVKRKITPQQKQERPPPTEGIAIYLLLDQSGSMGEVVSVYSTDGMRRKMTKIELLRQVTKEFISGNPALGLKGRPDDMIGLIAFARGADVLSPLTLDHEAIVHQLSKFNVVQQNDRDGTAIGYAIFKAANLIAATRHFTQELIEKGQPAYTIKSSVIILITDGMQDPNPLDRGNRLRFMDIPDAAAYVKEQGVHLYIINVEPKMATEEFAPQRHQMERAAALTGGKFFLMTNTTNLEQIYSQIDKLEKSQLPEGPEAVIDKSERPDLYRRISFYPYLIAFGLACLFSAFALDTTILRRVP